MADWVDLTGVTDRVRAPQIEPHRIGVSAEIEVAASVRVFTETDVDNYDIAGVNIATTQPAVIGKGSDGDRIFGTLFDLHEHGASAEWTIDGFSDWVAYAAATEDPDINDRILSKGNGKVKQAPVILESANITAGHQLIGDYKVIEKDTGNSRVLFKF